MNIERIVKLRNFLKTVPAENFRHGSWAGTRWDVADGEEFLLGEENICRTTACIAGWAAISEKLVPFTVKQDFISFDGDPYLIGDVVSEWLGLNAEEEAILFYPFDLDYPDDRGLNIDPDAFETAYSSEALGDGTTITEAIAYLNKVIETGEIRIEYWIEAKNKL